MIPWLTIDKPENPIYLYCAADIHTLQIMNLYVFGDSWSISFSKNTGHLLSIRWWSSLQKNVSSCKRSWNTVGKNSSSFRPNTQESWLRWRHSGQSLLCLYCLHHWLICDPFMSVFRAINKNISVCFIDSTNRETNPQFFLCKLAAQLFKLGCCCQ